nr:alpha/beta hydrolase [Leucobacter weissii]
MHGGNVANWMWEPQLPDFRDRLALTPDLPGFGSRTEEPWHGVDAAADHVVAGVRAAGVDGPFDLVGLSLGAIVALRVLARHGEAVPRAFVTGSVLVGVDAVARVATRLQLALWNAPWFWRAQAAAFRLPQDARAEFVAHGLSVRKENAVEMSRDVVNGRVPEALAGYGGALLAVAGEKESGAARRSLVAIRAALPSAEIRLAPGMHHVWNVEDPGLFSAVVRRWTAGEIDPRLRPA